MVHMPAILMRMAQWASPAQHTLTMLVLSRIRGTQRHFSPLKSPKLITITSVSIVSADHLQWYLTETLDQGQELLTQKGNTSPS